MASVGAVIDPRHQGRGFQDWPYIHVELRLLDGCCALIHILYEVKDTSGATEIPGKFGWPTEDCGLVTSLFTGVALSKDRQRRRRKDNLRFGIGVLDNHVDPSITCIIHAVKVIE